MLRNREIVHFILEAAGIAIAAAILCQFAELPPGLACAAGCFGIFALCMAYTLRRYRNISRLNDYLQKLSHGEKSLDIRDNAEGELSILKNELYKVAAALTERADALSKEKLELANALADISHQLKTPLTALGVMADLLEEDDLPPEKRRDFISNIRTGLNRMEWLALTLLKMARLDAEAIAFRREPIPLSTLIHRALSPLSIPIELKGQTVVMAGEDVNLLCDPEWTAEALGNILKNAVENAPECGSIEIGYGSNPLFTFIRVHDNGPGVSGADMPHLFKRFYQGQGAGRDGAGIGLAMSLSIARKQNGDIDVANDGGSVFTLKFYRAGQSDESVTGRFTEQSR